MTISDFANPTDYHRHMTAQAIADGDHAAAEHHAGEAVWWAEYSANLLDLLRAA